MTVEREYRLPGMAVTEHTFTVPLDYTDPRSAHITIFALELVAASRIGDDLPWLLFLQGGPGGKGPRPLHAGEGWLKRALQTHRVLLLDQRGTGRSTPLTWREAENFSSPEELARYIALLRTDSIVKDAELIREQLSPGVPWETLGQSYGGRITMAYLAHAPEGLKACYITGGLPSLDDRAIDMNRLTARRVLERMHEYFDRFPEDRFVVQRLRDLLAAHPMALPGGDAISLARTRQLGRLLGGTDGAAKLHWVLGDAFASDGQLSDQLVTAIQELTGYARNPLHPVLLDHVKIERGEPVAWPGARAVAELSEFSEDADELLLVGEVSFPWMFQELAPLRPFAEAMDILNFHTVWEPAWRLDDFANNVVPIVSAIYQEDMYVDADKSLKTSAAVPNSRHWITNEWLHDGLSRSGGGVLDRLMSMARDIDPDVRSAAAN
ncbi:alpha/beta fold hydrolase [Microbacterium arabinogalactanolyticum]|uniref:alpha/beta fold hydrolase n=1 Tax=Microbacterium arabinogalactanolyticum TaxID=69365 RepID=UPI00404474FD